MPLLVLFGRVIDTMLLTVHCTEAIGSLSYDTTSEFIVWQAVNFSSSRSAGYYRSCVKLSNFRDALIVLQRELKVPLLARANVIHYFGKKRDASEFINISKTRVELLEFPPSVRSTSTYQDSSLRALHVTDNRWFILRRHFTEITSIVGVRVARRGNRANFLEKVPRWRASTRETVP